jgi:hypothetical protein
VLIFSCEKLSWNKKAFIGDEIEWVIDGSTRGQTG